LRKGEKLPLTVTSRARLRFVGPVEPQPGTIVDRCPSGQLSIPVQARQVTVPVQRTTDVADEPGQAQLRRWLSALIEVAEGRRPAASLERKVSADLQVRLRGRHGLGIGARYVIRQVHVNRSEPGTLEYCATVYAPGRGRAFAVAGRLQAFWHGWSITDFEVISPVSSHPHHATVA